MTEVCRSGKEFQKSPTPTSEELRKLKSSILRERQEAVFCRDYWSHHSVYGSKLFTEDELLVNSPWLTPEARIIQSFLLNWKDRTFEISNRLGWYPKIVILWPGITLYDLYKSAWIDTQWIRLTWIEIPNGRSGWINRIGKDYGWKDELLMTVASLKSEPDTWIDIPAKKAWYKFDMAKEHQWTVMNELSHALNNKIFWHLFPDDPTLLTPPFNSFKCEIPGLKFRNNFQAEEFLSDVVDWIESKENSSFRFFNPLWYMHKDAPFWWWEEWQYWFSYQVQKYAMVLILKRKWIPNPEKVVEQIITKANWSDFRNHDEVFSYVRKYFQEKDFLEITEVYKRIWIQLLQSMKPYHKKKS